MQLIIYTIEILNIFSTHKYRALLILQIRNMTSLRTLRLTGNPIRYITAKDFEGLNNLRELRLDNMKVVSMDVTDLFPVLPALR